MAFKVLHLPIAFIVLILLKSFVQSKENSKNSNKSDYIDPARIHVASKRSNYIRPADKEKDGTNPVPFSKSNNNDDKRKLDKAITLPLPKQLDSVRDVSEPSKYTDTPVFWHVSKSGGTTMVDILSTCYGFVVAAEMGVLEGHDKDQTIQVVELNEGLRYVNVDTTTIPGIHRAAHLGLVPAHIAHVIVTPYFTEAADLLFNPGSKARMFTIIRHPIDRAISMFFYLQSATWESTYDKTLSNMTLEEYAQSDKAENNWMTRFLVNKPEEALKTDDIVLAREILRRKFLIGLLEYMDESVVRFERFFKWDVQYKDVQECKTKKWTNKHQHPKLEEGSNAWNALMAINTYDMELFVYATELFHKQRDFFVSLDEEGQIENPIKI